MKKSKPPLIPPSPSAAEYAPTPISPAEEKLFEEGAPMALFAGWLADAKAKEPNDPNAVALATVDSAGAPDVRMVLLKDFDEQGFVFYSNSESTKGRQLTDHPQAALCFHWKSLRRQVRVRGPVSEVSGAEADSYFATRARDAQIGAWASAQSAPMQGRFVLERKIAETALRFGAGPPPRPPFWRGYRVAALSIEFWRDRPFRLHDRLLFSRDAVGQPWRKQRLFP